MCVFYVAIEVKRGEMVGNWISGGCIVISLHYVAILAFYFHYHIKHIGTGKQVGRDVILEGVVSPILIFSP